MHLVLLDGCHLFGRYKIIVPDLRGYNQSSQPPGVDAYQVKNIVADVVSLARKEVGQRSVLNPRWTVAVVVVVVVVATHDPSTPRSAASTRFK